jgi:CBS domain-containing protein
MTREVVHVAPDLSVARAVSDYFWRYHVTSFPVLDGGRVVGLLSIHGVGEVPQDRWESTVVRDVMLPLTDALSAAPGDRVPAALDKLSRNGLGRLAVLDHGRLAGYLSLKDVMHVLTVSTAGGAVIFTPGLGRQPSRSK